MTGPRPVRLPDLTVRAKRPNPLEVSLRLMGAPEDIRALGIPQAQQRREAFHHDMPRALPGGMVKAVGDFGTDVASVDLPFLPPLLPGVQQQGSEWTQALVEGLHKVLGAPVGSEGTQAGEELGGLVASALPVEYVLPVVGKALDRLPNLEAGARNVSRAVASPFTEFVNVPVSKNLHDVQLYQTLQDNGQFIPRWLQEAVDAHDARVAAEEAALGISRPPVAGERSWLPQMDERGAVGVQRVPPPTAPKQFLSLEDAARNAGLRTQEEVAAMTPAELGNYRRVAREAWRSLENAVLGEETAMVWRKAQQVANEVGMSPTGRFAEADRTIAAIEDAMTPAQRSIIFGLEGNPLRHYADPEWLRDGLRAGRVLPTPSGTEGNAAVRMLAATGALGSLGLTGAAVAQNRAKR